MTRALNDPDAVVRLAAVEALAGHRSRHAPALSAAHARGSGARGAHRGGARARGSDGARLTADDRPRFESALAEYIAAQTYNADRPKAAAALGNLYATRGDAQGAIAEYRKALALDPTFVPAYANLADLYRARGADGEAETILRAGVAKVPKRPRFTTRSAWSLVRQKRYADALKEFAQASRLDPANARYAYVEAVALYDTGQTQQALKVAGSRAETPSVRP